MGWAPPEHDHQRELRDHLSIEDWHVPIALIAARHDLDASNLFPFSTGSDIVWSAGAHVIKLTAPMWTSEIAAEAAALQRVQGELDVATPNHVATGDIEGWPYVVMSHVPGQPIGELWADLDGADRVRLAGDLGRLTRAVNELGDESEAGAWPAFWEACTKDVGERHLKRGGPPEIAKEIDGFLAEVGELVPSAYGFLHTELLDVHILGEERAGRVELSGLIDFADSCVGPVEYEFAAPIDFLFKGEPGALRAFLLGYGVDESDLGPERSRRLLAWSLCHRFGSLPRMLAACGDRKPGTLEELAARLFDVQAR